MIKIAEKIWYAAREDSPCDLSYMTAYEDNAACRKKQATGRKWSSRRGYSPNNTREEILDNTPTVGFSIVDTVTRWSTSNKLFRVTDPRGFTVEVPTGNILNLLKHSTVVNGVVQQPCIWGSEGGNHLLIPEGSELYSLAQRDSDIRESAVNLSKLKPLQIFTQISREEKNWYRYLMLGTAKITWKKEVKRGKRTYAWGSHYSHSDEDLILSTELIEDSKPIYVYTNLTTTKDGKVVPSPYTHSQRSGKFLTKDEFFEDKDGVLDLETLRNSSLRNLRPTTPFVKANSDYKIHPWRYEDYTEFKVHSVEWL